MNNTIKIRHVKPKPTAVFDLMALERKGLVKSKLISFSTGGAVRVYWDAQHKGEPMSTNKIIRIRFKNKRMERKGFTVLFGMGGTFSWNGDDSFNILEHHALALNKAKVKYDLA